MEMELHAIQRIKPDVTNMGKNKDIVATLNGSVHKARIRIGKDIFSFGVESSKSWVILAMWISGILGGLAALVWEISNESHQRAHNYFYYFNPFHSLYCWQDC